MAPVLGRAEWTYDEVAEWEQLPAGWAFIEVADVAVDAADRVYVCSRGQQGRVRAKRR